MGGATSVYSENIIPRSSCRLSLNIYLHFSVGKIHLVSDILFHRHSGQSIIKPSSFLYFFALKMHTHASVLILASYIMTFCMISQNGSNGREFVKVEKSLVLVPNQRSKKEN